MKKIEFILLAMCLFSCGLGPEVSSFDSSFIDGSEAPFSDPFSSDQPVTFSTEMVGTEPSDIFVQSQEPEIADEYAIWINPDFGTFSIYYCDAWEMQYSGADGPLFRQDYLLREDIIGLLMRAAIRTICVKSITVVENYATSELRSDGGSIYSSSSLLTYQWCEQKWHRTAFSSAAGRPELHDDYVWLDEDGPHYALYWDNNLLRFHYDPAATYDNYAARPMRLLSTLLFAEDWVSVLEEEDVEWRLPDEQPSRCFSFQVAEKGIKVFATLDATASYFEGIGFYQETAQNEDGATPMTSARTFTFSHLNQTQFDIPQRVIEDESEWRKEEASSSSSSLFIPPM